jgi:hypothetical protein
MPSEWMFTGPACSHESDQSDSERWLCRIHGVVSIGAPRRVIVSDLAAHIIWLSTLAEPVSIRHITGAPIMFLGTGEKSDSFEPFHPDHIVGRIMGFGDIATLLEHAEEKLDRKKA